MLDICRAVGAKTVTKGKSMIGEEIALNDHLEANGITPVETDLGEYIIQLRHEPPSHIIAPAIHLMKEQVAETFRAAHTDLDPARPLDRGARSCATRRARVLRPQFLAADVGITGANFLIAETGSSIIVTNEGNGDLTQTLPRVHIVLASIEKIVPTLEDAATLLRLLARSATGQEFSSYTTFSTGPRRPGDLDGPEQYHVVLLDNGRSAMLGSEFQEMLRCIRCAACLNHCPVYAAVGGHAYGWVYPGPMGAVLTPALIGVDEAGHLPNASTFCGRCESVCPVKIPLPKMMRHWREREFAAAADAAGLPHRAVAVGLGRAPAGALSRWPRSPAERSAGLAAGAAAFAACRWPAAGPRCATCRRRRAAASTACGPSGSKSGAAAMSARDDILGGIRAALRRGPLAGERQAAAARAGRGASPQSDPGAGGRARSRRRGSTCSSRWPRRCRRRSTRVASPAEVPGRGRALSRRREPAGRAGHGARSGASTRSPGTTRPLLRIRRGRAEADGCVSA